MLAILFGSVSVSESLSNFVLSISDDKTVSKSVSSEEGASWATDPILKFLGTSIIPESNTNSFKINLNNVVFPVPFLPTIPTLCPVGTNAEEFSKSENQQIEKEISLKLIIL